jgi:hypothetical protein
MRLTSTEESPRNAQVLVPDLLRREKPQYVHPCRACRLHLSFKTWYTWYTPAYRTCTSLPPCLSSTPIHSVPIKPLCCHQRPAMAIYLPCRPAPHENHAVSYHSWCELCAGFSDRETLTDRSYPTVCMLAVYAFGPFLHPCA